MGRFKRAHEYPQQALVSTTTHDLATLAGFWNGTDIEARRFAVYWTTPVTTMRKRPRTR